MKSRFVILLPAFACAVCATPGASKSQAPSQGQAIAQIPATQAQAKSPANTPAPPRPVSPPAVPDLMPGTDCTTAKMPELKYDSDEHQLRLANGAFKMSLPKGWKVELERADLAVITSPESNKGVRPVFEMFVSPVCKKYESFVVHRRVAARGLTELLPKEETIAQIADGHWHVGPEDQEGRALADGVRDPVGRRQELRAARRRGVRQAGEEGRPARQVRENLLQHVGQGRALTTACSPRVEHARPGSSLCWRTGFRSAWLRSPAP